MSVRYVLTAVLPRYTMSGAKRPAPPARARRREADAPQMLTADGRIVELPPCCDDARVMGHE